MLNAQADIAWLANVKEIGSGFVAIVIVIYGLRFLAIQIQAILSFMKIQNDEKIRTNERLSNAIVTQGECHKAGLEHLADTFKSEMRQERAFGKETVTQILDRLAETHEDSVQDLAGRLGSFTQNQQEINKEILMNLAKVQLAFAEFKGLPSCQTSNSLPEISTHSNENMDMKSLSKERPKG